MIKLNQVEDVPDFFVFHALCDISFVCPLIEIEKQRLIWLFLVEQSLFHLFAYFFIENFCISDREE